MVYIPQPRDTSHIELPDQINALIEDLARNTHEVWSKERMINGWRYGPRRDDAAKHHPCLVPYEELSDSEKEYDRKTASETLKLIVAMGYTIMNSQ